MILTDFPYTLSFANASDTKLANKLKNAGFCPMIVCISAAYAAVRCLSSIHLFMYSMLLVYSVGMNTLSSKFFHHR